MPNESLLMSKTAAVPELDAKDYVMPLSRKGMKIFKLLFMKPINVTGSSVERNWNRVNLEPSLYIASYIVEDS